MKIQVVPAPDPRHPDVDFALREFRTSPRREFCVHGFRSDNCDDHPPNLEPTPKQVPEESVKEVRKKGESHE